MTTKKPFLTFVIPTWTRPKELEVCVRSIAEQIVAINRRDEEDDEQNELREPFREITVLVSDDASGDNTLEVVTALQVEFPGIITYRCREQRKDYSDAFYDMFTVPDAEWVWTFGDDDQLEPGGLETILKLLPTTDCEFIHVSEKGRYSGTNGLYKGDLWTLCNTFGWLEMTGFITCNITRGARLKEAAASRHWISYAKSAFVQSCALLEVLKDAPAALWDVPLVSTQNETQTQDCIDRWTANKIPERYLLIGDALETMYDYGILKKKVKRAFFRYQNYHLWDRHLTYYIADYLMKGGANPAERWGALTKLCAFLDDEKLAGTIYQSIETARGMINLHGYLTANVDGIRQGIQELSDTHNESCYPWGYVIPREAL